MSARAGCTGCGRAAATGTVPGIDADDLEYAKTPGGMQVAFRVISRGQGVPVLYLPGMVYSIDAVFDDPPYAHFISSLSDIAPLVLLERQGIGASDPLDMSADLYDQWVEDVVAVLDQLGVERAHLVGYAIGADIGLATARRAPERVASVFALHSVLQFPEEVIEVLRPRMAKVVERDDAAAEDSFAEGVPSRATDQAYLDWNRRSGRRAASPTVAAQLWDAVLRPSDLYRELVEIDVPVAVACRRGYADFLGGVARMEAIVAAMPNAQLVVLDGGDLVPNAGDVDGLLFEIAQFIHGDEHATRAARPLTCLLFTDLVGSTAAARTMGDADWRSLLDQHDHRIERTLRRHGGVLVKATGDGALTTFDTPTRALSCAVALRDELAVLGLQVRMGIHIGEIERRGTDVAGIAVHLAARVMAAADAGEVLVSAAVPLATLGGRHRFEPHGQFELKGFDGTFDLFRLVPGS